ncbi:Serine/arginine-rich splicing factor 5 [Trichinella pseudospiralis]|uniref:Serine/arginine-rich splicing factor 5 n=1 Tax=Trichinella pseudospiralis TaxID=6337 RepID=A0A0V0XWP2_TRIPS|nr:Serine/arginine-rich splicing factor 5 [Trichinella pseudospiralis]
MFNNKHLSENGSGEMFSDSLLWKCCFSLANQIWPTILVPGRRYSVPMLCSMSTRRLSRGVGYHIHCSLTTNRLRPVRACALVDRCCTCMSLCKKINTRRGRLGRFLFLQESLFDQRQPRLVRSRAGFLRRLFFHFIIKLYHIFILDLKDFMRQAGEVTYADAHRIKKHEGIVCFASHYELKKAIDMLNGKELNGRKLELFDGSPLLVLEQQYKCFKSKPVSINSTSTSSFSITLLIRTVVVVRVQLLRTEMNAVRANASRNVQCRTVAVGPDLIPAIESVAREASARGVVLTIPPAGMRQGSDSGTGSPRSGSESAASGRAAQAADRRVERKRKVAARRSSASSTSPKRRSCSTEENNGDLSSRSPKKKLNNEFNHSEVDEVASGDDIDELEGKKKLKKKRMKKDQSVEKTVRNGSTSSKDDEHGRRRRSRSDNSSDEDANKSSGSDLDVDGEPKQQRTRRAGGGYGSDSSQSD